MDELDGGRTGEARRRSQCKECAGAGICKHQLIRSRCKECGGASICQHQRIRTGKEEDEVYSKTKSDE
jgi:hypothetical protein